MTKLLAIAALTALAAGGWWLLSGPSQAPEVNAVRIRRADVVNTLTTNGRIQASRRFDVFAEAGGRVTTVAVQIDDDVRAGQTLATLDSGMARSALAAATARLDAAKSRMRALEEGLPPAERADLDSRIAALQASLQDLHRDRETTSRLVERQAAPRMELEELDRKILTLENDREALARKLRTQPAPAELDAARAAVREAHAAVDQAERSLHASAIRAPTAGRIYSLALRPGDYIAPGALAARLAAGDRVEAVIFVDEPELGRVSLGAEAVLTADAYPDRRWSCTVERLPSEIVERDTRRVGEIRCGVSGKADGLIPNLTVDVAIQTAIARNSLAAPREAIQRDAAGDFIWTLDETSHPRRTPVEIGVRGADRVEIRSGLEEGRLALLPAGLTLSEDRPVAAVESKTP